MTSHLPAIFKSAEKEKKTSGIFGKRWFCNTLVWFPQEWLWHKGFPGEDQHDTHTTTEQFRGSCWVLNLRGKDRGI